MPSKYKIQSPFTHLDCTFRDGGYYNDWNFDEAAVNDYLGSMATAGIDVIELGFRFLKNDRFLGAFLTLLTFHRAAE